MATYLITGCSRGLGLALVKQLISLPNTQVGIIFATARSNISASLQNLVDTNPGRVIFVQLDTTSKSSISNAVTTVEQHLHGQGLDVLINNAGIQTICPAGMQAVEDLNEVFHANVTSVQMMTSAFLPLLSKGSQKKVINMSSATGSITWAPRYAAAPAQAYKISKAALNMLTVQYALQFADKGFIFVPMCPGLKWLQTDLGTARGDLPVDVGAKAVVDVVLRADHSFNGVSQNIKVPGWENATGRNQYNGKSPPW